jgi:hypothetical protein
MIDFSKLKNARGSNLASLTEKLDSMNKGSGSQKDERIFKPTFDKKEEKGYAVIRFLPNKHGEPFVRVFSHAFKGAGGWYLESSRSTINEDDPVSISNRLYWNKGEETGNENLKNIVKGRKRNTKYFANAFVIKDQYNPAVNGKVMIYEFGAQIFKKIEAAAKPEFEDDKPLDPFDMWSGADFKIKIVGKEMPGQGGTKVIVPNYENSEFAGPSEFLASDEEREAMFNQTFDLTPFLKVKSFDELATRFEKVTGEKHNALETGEPGQAAANRVSTQHAMQEQQSAPAQAPAASAQLAASIEEDDDDDILAQFRQLANS